MKKIFTLLLISLLFAPNIRADEQNPGIFDYVSIAHDALKTDLLQTMMLKTLASCHYISGISIKNCEQRAQLPISIDVLQLPVDIYFHREKKIAFAYTGFLGFFISLGGARHSRNLTVVTCEDEKYGCRVDNDMQNTQSFQNELCRRGEAWYASDSINEDFPHELWQNCDQYYRQENETSGSSLFPRTN